MLRGPARLRVVNVQDVTTQAQCTIELRKTSSAEGSGETIALLNRQWQVDAAVDVGWEGDIVIDSDWIVQATFEGTANLDRLVLTVGYETV